jgi:hypothetical protein
VAFGAIQLTPLRIAPGLPNLAQQRQALKPLIDEAKTLNVALNQAPPDSPEYKELLGRIKANRELQAPYDKEVKATGNSMQLYQELGGLAGRIALAVLIIIGMGRRALLRLFQVPGLVALPLTYFLLYKQDAAVFAWGMAAVGFVTVAQFSYFGEYLPKVFPLHLRGTGGSFATNVGGRMIGTSAAFLTTNIVAPFVSGGPFDQVAFAAGCVGLGIVAISVVIGFFLPEPSAEELPAVPAGATRAEVASP